MDKDWFQWLWTHCTTCDSLRGGHALSLATTQQFETFQFLLTGLNWRCSLKIFNHLWCLELRLFWVSRWHGCSWSAYDVTLSPTRFCLKLCNNAKFVFMCKKMVFFASFIFLEVYAIGCNPCGSSCCQTPQTPTFELWSHSIWMWKSGDGAVVGAFLLSNVHAHIRLSRCGGGCTWRGF